MILVDEKKLGNALKACLSDSEFPLERRQAVLRAVRKEEKVVKKKISAALVFAIVLMLAVGGAAQSAAAAPRVLRLFTDIVPFLC